MRKKAAAVALAGVAVGASVGVAQAGAQYLPYPPADPSPTSPSPAPAPKQAKNTVVIKGASATTYRFSPKTLKAKHGTRVKWSWKSNAPHNVTFTKLHKHSKTRAHGTYALRFAKAGTYRYKCTIHGFTGKVVVK
jgi:plastocyanin